MEVESWRNLARSAVLPCHVLKIVGIQQMRNAGERKYEKISILLAPNKNIRFLMEVDG